MTDSEYRPRARDKVQRRTKELRPFGIARNVNLDESEVFKQLVRSIPELSNHSISRKKVKKNPSLKLINRGLTRSVLIGANRRVEQKDVFRWEGEVVDAVNGRGHELITLTPEDVKPQTISSRGHVLGSFVVRKESAFYQQLREGNEVALSALASEYRADSSSHRSPLEPRIDVFKARDNDTAWEVIDRADRLLRHDSGLIHLDPAKPYRDETTS